MAEEYFILDSESTSSVDPTINPPVSVDTLRIGSNSQELNKTFGRKGDYIDVHIYDTEGNLELTVNDCKDYSIIGEAPSNTIDIDGKIIISNYDGKTYSLGSNDRSLQAKLVIKKPGFTIDILNKGSVGLAESYMRGDFETDNLTNLIEITAKNIKKVH